MDIFVTPISQMEKERHKRFSVLSKFTQIMSVCVGGRVGRLERWLSSPQPSNPCIGNSRSCGVPLGMKERWTGEWRHCI